MNRRALSLNQSRSDRRSALAVGQQRALEGLARGRLNAIRNSRIIGALNISRVMAAALKDLAVGGPARGRAKRIAIDLEGKLTERSVLRILDRLLACPIAVAHNGENSQ